ncbi:MAG TPA: peptidase MA family metallohydrolase [Candidatus Hydrogenedens sp.]|nr:hypothetical protein [Candidatus Hydrogenedens sp.]HOK09015.1 peptidase MA family metallohydrolase [Candidatus Hydrogenedens sp.]HOL20171.1 peptidase MA family metallohydrolase [Candidatus Hydrogenedens sp.]HPP58002.1 peptidase MA family metallohydrolase [Candidatus Hydrogenedens sp.]
MFHVISIHFLIIAYITLGQNELQQLETDHSVVFYSPEDRAQAEYAGKVIEQAWGEYSRRLQIENNEAVQIWIIRESQDFKVKSGGRSPFLFGGVAHSGKGVIIVKSPRLRNWGEDFAGTLRHELMHVFISRAGLESQLPLWFNEGLSMYVANEYYWSTGLRMSQIVLTNRLIEYRFLDRELMLANSPDKTNSAYIQSLSMVQYLVKTLGDETFWKMVNTCKGERFVKALNDIGGITLDEFWYGYRKSLWIVTIMGAIATGSIFTPIAILAVFVFLWVWQRNRKQLQVWEEEEIEEEQLGIRSVPWEHLTQEPYDWEMDNDDE